MRYKAYILIKTTLSCGPGLYFRHGNHFKDVNEDDAEDFGFKNLTEVEAGVWSQKISLRHRSMVPDTITMSKTYMVPESNEFFNLYTLEKGFFYCRSSVIKTSIHDKIRALVIKYLLFLKS